MKARTVDGTSSTGVRGRMRSLARLAAGGMAGVLVLSATGFAPTAASSGSTDGVTERVSVSSDGAEANILSDDTAISADGRHVAFGSIASVQTGLEPDPFLFGRAAVTANWPRAAAIGDVDGDGLGDLVVGGGGVGTPDGIEVLAGLPTGSFDRGRVTESPGMVRSVQLVDLDGDGNLDVLAGVGYVGREGKREVGVFPGAGDGGFAPVVQPELPVANAMTAGRLLPGERPVVAVAHDAGIEVYRLGPGLLFEAVASIGEPGVRWVDAADLTGDGVEQLVAWNEQEESVTVYRDLAVAATIDAPGATAFRLADATGDGRPEILVGTEQGDVTAFDTDLQPIRTLEAASGAVWDLQVVDFDGDGGPDVVTTHPGALLEANFADGRRQVVELHEAPGGILVADATGNGLPDLLVPHAGEAVEILLNDGSGTLPPIAEKVETARYSWHVDLGDFNADGFPDLLASQSDPLVDHLTPEAARIFLGDGEGGFELSAELDTSGAPQGAAAGDFNGDGILDVLVADTLPYLGQFLGEGDGTFGPRVPGPGCLNPMTIEVADFDGDAYDDAVAVCRNVGGVGPDQAMTLFGTPAGLVRGQQLMLPDAWYGMTARLGDINGDGLPDIVVGSAMHHPLACAECVMSGPGPSVITYFLGRDEERLWEPVGREYEVGDVLSDIRLVDLDGDGRDDILTTVPAGHEVRVVPGLATGELGEPYSIPTLSRPLGMELADLNGDGMPDLVLSHERHNVISIALGSENGFGPPIGHPTRGWAWRVPVADLNGDGKTDLMAGLLEHVEPVLQR